MTEIRWETKHRYYAVRVYQDLLGDWVIHSVWGGLQSNLGNGHQQVVPSHEDVAMVLERIHKERRAGATSLWRRAKARASPDIGSCAPPKLTSSTSSSWHIAKMQYIMKPMTRSELITAISLRFPQLGGGDVAASVTTILNGMTECLSRQARIEIRGFGTFFVNYRPPRIGRNPKTGDPLDVPGKRAPRFKGGKELVLRVNPLVRAGHVHVGASGAA